MGSLRGMGLGVCGFALAMTSQVTLAQMPVTDPMGGAGAQTSGRSAKGQQMPQQQPSLPPMSPDGPFPEDGKLQHDQAKLRNIDRQKQIVADTQKLVELANQLQADVQKSNKDTLSLDVIRKADEIEKLAKSVREKMKGS